MTTTMKQLHHNAHQKTPSKAIHDDTNNLKKLLNHPDLVNLTWPDIFSWLTKLNIKPNNEWTLHPTHSTIRAQVARIPTTNKATTDFEVHLLHYDIYLCLKGGELVSFFWLGDISNNKSYDKKTDNLFWHPSPEIKPTKLSMSPGTILILPPGEAHLPTQSDNIHNSVTKIIAKIPSAFIDT